MKAEIAVSILFLFDFVMDAYLKLFPMWEMFVFYLSAMLEITIVKKLVKALRRWKF